MVTLGNIDPFWDDEYIKLNYKTEQFNNNQDLTRWVYQGYRHDKFTGEMCDMRQPQPTWNDQFINYFKDLGWQDVCTSYYKMTTGTILPTHSDTYKSYKKVFNISDTSKIKRALVFLEDWSSGHYLEVDGNPIVSWLKGNYIIWEHNTPHMAANIGTAPRYTLQITGHTNG